MEALFVPFIFIMPFRRVRQHEHRHDYAEEIHGAVADKEETENQLMNTRSCYFLKSYQLRLPEVT